MLTIGVYVISEVAVSVIAVRGAQADVTSELSALVSTSVADIVTEPLKLGSFVEARIRIQSFIDNGLFECADLVSEGLPISRCDLDKSKLKAFAAPLKLTERAGVVNPVLITYVNQSKLERSAYKRSFAVILFVISFGLVFLFLLIYILKLFAKEIAIIIRDDDNGGFQIPIPDEDTLSKLQASSVTYRFATGKSKGKKAMVLKSVTDNDHTATKGLVVKNSGFSLHAGVATKAHERDRLEKVCRYIARPAVSEERLSTNDSADVIYRFKKPATCDSCTAKACRGKFSSNRSARSKSPKL